MATSTQFYSDQTGRYQVDKLYPWVNSHTNKQVDIPLSPLLTYIIHDTWSNEDIRRSNFKALLEDKEHRRRVEEANLNYPIIVTNFNLLIDGVHRLFKAIIENRTSIKVIFINQDQLNAVKTTPAKPHPPSHVPELPFEDQYLTLPHDRLPPNPTDRRNLIEDYFPDFLPSVQDKQDHYEICLERPSSPYGNYEYDKDIRAGLNWWEKGTRIRDIPAKYRLFDGGILALEEQWVPLSWSHALKKMGKIPREAVLLHLDDHRDMMSPRIGKRMDGQLVDYITGREIDFLDPETVSKAIISGAIGKGSILTPLIWTIPKVHVRHLCFRPHPGTTYQLETVCSADGILFPLANRIGLTFEDTSWDNLTHKSNYVVTPDVECWIKRLPPDVPIFLHFDLDYFNNRFDGSSEWQTSGGRSFELDMQSQEKQLSAILNVLEKNGLVSHVVDLSIGISPGFYPAEFWHTMIEMIRKKGKAIGLKLFE